MNERSRIRHLQRIECAGGPRIHGRRRLSSISLALLAFGCLLVADGCKREETPPLPAQEEAEPEDPPLAPTAESKEGEKPASGRWSVPPPEAGVAADDLEMLEALGYVGASQPARGSGVTRHREGEALPGYNLYSSGATPSAVLMDMDGRVLHRWQAAFRDLYPGVWVRPKDRNRWWWRRVLLLPGGDLLAIFEGLALVRLDRDSNVVWKSWLRPHHDMRLLPDGDLLVLTRQRRRIPEVSSKTVVEDSVSRIDLETGTVKSSFSLVTAFLESPFADLLPDETLAKGQDIFHTNALFVIPEPGHVSHPAFRPGNFLISLRTPSVIAVVDPETERVVWAHRDGFKFQHDPTLLQNGNVLLFDNFHDEQRSALLEIDPLGPEIVWTWEGTAAEPFFSPTCGAARRLANGNTLVTETDGGRAFELNAEAEIVWEFYNPDRGGDEQQYIGAIAEMLRLPTSLDLSWLE